LFSKIPDGSLEIVQILDPDQLYTVDDIDKKLPSIELSTLRYAIRRLLEADIIQSIPDLQDMRTVKYRMAPETHLSKALQKLPPNISSLLQHEIEKKKSSS